MHIWLFAKNQGKNKSQTVSCSWVFNPTRGHAIISVFVSKVHTTYTKTLKGPFLSKTLCKKKRKFCSQFHLDWLQAQKVEKPFRCHPWSHWVETNSKHPPFLLPFQLVRVDLSRPPWLGEWIYYVHKFKYNGQNFSH